MPESTVKYYEGMFLLPQSAVADLQAAAEHIRTILSKHGAEIISLQKWDERRLAYDIRGNKRGLYFLVYFSAAPSALTEIERECNLSEQLLRSMILRAEHLTLEQMQAADRQQELADEARLRAEGITPEAADNADTEADGRGEYTPEDAVPYDDEEAETAARPTAQ